MGTHPIFESDFDCLTECKTAKMSFVNKLEIQGIRSVGPNDDNALKVKFFRPFTLITGENGAGKTTIIEALKYATSGVMPPGASKGGWLHHPKLEPNGAKTGDKRSRARKTAAKVLARIQCEFEMKQGDDKLLVQTSRQIEATFDVDSKKGMKQSTLDSSIVVRKKSTGVKIREEQGMKIVDMNKTINTYLRIPQPILEYVVFCHQEDTLWPFYEAKTLKEIFDKIFQTDEFQKVLDHIKKDVKSFEKENPAKMQVLQATRRLYENMCETKSKIAKLELEQTVAQAQIDQLSETTKPLKERNESLLNIINHSANYIDQYKQLKSRIAELTEDLTAQEAKSDMIRLTADELNYSLDAVTSKIEQIQSGELMIQLRDELTAMNGAKTQHELEVSELRGEVIQAEKTKAECNDSSSMLGQMSAKLAAKLKIAADSQHGAVIGALQGEIEKDLHIELAHQREVQERIEQLEKDYSSFTTQKATHEASKNQGYAQIDEKRVEIGELRNRLSNLSQAAERLKKATSDEKAVTRQIDAFQAQSKLGQMDNELDTLKKALSRVTDRIEQLEQQKESARVKADAERDLAEKQVEYQSAMETLDETMMKIESLLKKKGNEIPELDDLRNSQAEAKRTNKRASERRDLSNKQFLTKSADMTSVSKELSKTRRELNSLRQSPVLDDSLDTTLDEEKSTLSKLETTLVDLEEDFAAIKQGKKLFQSFLKKVKQKPECPLCENHLGNRREKVIELCETKMAFSNERELGDEIRQTKSNIDQSKLAVQKMAKIEELERAEEEQKKRLKMYQDEKKVLERDYETAKREATKTNDELNNLLGVEPFVKSARGAKNRALALEKRVKGLREKLSSVANAPDLIQLSREIKMEKEMRSTNQLKLTRLEEERKCVESEATKMGEKREKLRNELAKLRLTQGESDSSLQTRLDQLEADCGEIKATFAQLDGQIAELKTALVENRNQRQAIREDSAQFLTRLTEKMDRKKDRKLKYEAAISQHIDKFGENDADAFDSTIDEFKSSLAKTQKLLQKVESKIEEGKGRLAMFEVEESKLRDVADYIGKYQKREEKKNELDDLKRRMHDEGMGNMRKAKYEHEELTRQINENTHKIVAQKGQLEEKVKHIAQEKIAFEQATPDEAKSKYRTAVKEHVINKLTKSDLNLFYGVLEAAISTIHKDKIMRLNHMIAHLWKTTYQGADIESISVMCDTSETKVATARASYNYAVMMRRFDGTMLPMRGRASAGLRILASLIIRLALARCFTHCGILALDEPTTNLDRRNIRQFVATLRNLANDVSGAAQFII